MGNYDLKRHDANHRLTKQERLLRIFLALTAAFVLIAIYFWNPDAYPLTVCKFHKLTGVSCPTCGMSRSLQAASHLRILESLKFHAGGWAVLAFLAFFFMLTFTEAIRGEKMPVMIPSRQKKLLFWGIIFLWIFSWIVNITRDVNLL